MRFLTLLHMSAQGLRFVGMGIAVNLPSCVLSVLIVFRLFRLCCQCAGSVV